MATPTTYKVKKGDTLSGIAKNLGVSADSITGYKSGNANLIYPEETLTISSVPKTSVTQDQASKMSTKDLSIALAGGDYASTVKDELGEGTTDVPDYKTDYDTYKKSREDSFTKLKGIATETFDTEYKSRKLDDSKNRISELDDEIAAARQLRDDAIGKVRSNPGLSAAQMTGDIAKLTDSQNATINNLIGQRNSVASEYNASLDEIDGIVDRATKDAQLEFSYWDGLTQEASGLMAEYEKALREELSATQEQDNFEKQLAQQLEIALMKENSSGSGNSGSDDNWKLIYNDLGDPLYWYNSKTKEIDYNVGAPQGDAPTDPYSDIEEEVKTSGGGGGGGGGGIWQGLKNWWNS